MEYTPRSRKFVVLFKKMLIGEISDKTQLSRDTIRFYEKKGLIKVAQSNSEFNNYKNYSEENLKHLMLIKKAKKFGFTLNEINEILNLFQAKKANCSTMRNKITSKIQDIDLRIRELENMKSLILSQVKDASFKCGNKQNKNNCLVFEN